MKPRIVIVLSVAVGLISTAAVLIKLAEAPVIVIAAYRMGISALLLAPVAWTFRRKEIASLSRNQWGFFLLGGLFLSLHFLTWIASLQFTSVASSVVLVTTNPIFVGLGSVFLLNERLSPLLVGGIVLSVLGGFLIGYGDLRLGGGALYGDLLALLGAVAGSAYLLVGRRVRSRTDTLTYVSVVYGIAGFVLVVSTALQSRAFLGYSTMTYLVMILLALGPQLIGHSSFNWALRYLRAPTVAVIILGEPIGATVLAYFVLGEGITPLKTAGGVLVLMGIYLAARAENTLDSVPAPSG